MLDRSKRYLIVGLGLLGGKYALELTRAGFAVDAVNRSEKHLQYALDKGYIRSGKTHDFEDLVAGADHIIFGLYPATLLEWFKTYGHLIKPGCIFTDVSGVKTGLVEPIQAMCPPGAEFIASHPMAGRETSGVEHAAEVNFAPANFIITPTEKNTPRAIVWITELAEVLGFEHISTLTPAEHDRMIGYVSQLCHAIAVSLMCANDNTALCEYTGDSFRDLTVVRAVFMEPGKPDRRDRPVRRGAGSAAAGSGRRRPGRPGRDVPPVHPAPGQVRQVTQAAKRREGHGQTGKAETQAVGPCAHF